jgi:putative ABC transport system ATP-binding protein
MTVHPVLEFIDVVKTFGRGTSEVRALGGVDLTVAPGEFVAVMGPSGCGKSTLLHIAGGLEDPSSGRVRVQGRDIGDLDLTERATLRRTEVGYVFQRLNLLPSLSALENVSLPLELDGVGGREATRRATEALAGVGLTEQLKRYPDDFSGGQQQRIAIARAIVAQRSLILADEPTGALDTITGDSVIALLASLPATHGTAVVLVTHEPRFASWADRVLFMRDGQVVDQTASVADLIASGVSAGAVSGSGVVE